MINQLHSVLVNPQLLIVFNKLVMISMAVAVVGIRVSRITIRSLSISRPLVVSMVGISVSVVGSRVGSITMVGITVVGISVIGIRVGSISVMAISMVAIRGVSIGHAIAGISFRLSNNSCEQAQGNNSEGLHLY